MAGYGGNFGLASFLKDAGLPLWQRGSNRGVQARRLRSMKSPPVVDLPFAEPPPREGSLHDIFHSQILYNRFCSRCHTFGRGELPDLRRLSPATQAIFYDILLKGLYAPMGMGRFDDVLSRRMRKICTHSSLIGRGTRTPNRIQCINRPTVQAHMTARLT